MSLNQQKQKRTLKLTTTSGALKETYFIYRHHVEPRVLYVPREESFPTPLKYIDVTRTSHTQLVVLQEKRINDCWNVDGVELGQIRGQD